MIGFNFIEFAVINLGLCYHVKRTKLTWKDAHDDCLSMSDSYYNSDLVSIHSASEMQFIKSKLHLSQKSRRHRAMLHKQELTSSIKNIFCVFI